ncbi:Ig-like domain-containing protein [Streptomyces sp. NPDC090021]|uniref:L,D-transpeptidase n=1 Tax=Streptomyces sp. NPDC090021 TaxID=3365919 RepID=UPI0037F2CE58
MRTRAPHLILTSAALAAGALLPSVAHAAGPATPAPSPPRPAAAAQGEDTRPLLTITPGDGSRNVPTTGTPGVTVNHGTLTAVTMTTVAGGRTAGGHTLRGTFSEDHTTWRPATTTLAAATVYRIDATGKAPDGRSLTQRTTFTTAGPAGVLTGYLVPGDRTTVGVGMPVSVTFDKPVTDRARVAAAIHVTSTSGQKAVGHWFGSQRLDFRPRDFWKADSDITVDMDLRGVTAGPGLRGDESRTSTFHVGRAQISTVDAAAKTMQVVRDDKPLRTLPISAGAPESPTYNGTMVISEKHHEMRMNGSSVGYLDEDGKPAYDIPDVPHAMRLSDSGTFVHGNYWAPTNVFGQKNTSHGCIGLADVKGGATETTPAAWLYANSLVGDVVVVKNSGDRTISPDNGLSDWNLPWSAWVRGAAS